MKKLIKIGLVLSFTFYVFILTILLFFGGRSNGWMANLTFLEYMKYSSNFVPFKTISTYINAIFSGNMNLDIPLKNLFGNLLMFLPMGIYLPYFIKRLKRISSFSVTFMIILLVIKITQSISRRGSFDIDDFILNTIGALIGFGVWKKFFRR
ncbi:VanZ family protein [Niallia sp. FSL W8-1348]|uniref:VanZ family protein n=1 Tax=Niallia sp. FSL W8-1348 TaxID=2954656 RepID=UPI0030F7B430